MDHAGRKNFETKIAFGQMNGKAVEKLLK